MALTKHYSNVEEARLSDYITAQIFRTVLSQQRNIPTGYSEIAVEIDTKKKFASTLSFPVSWDGVIYGYVRDKSILEKKIGDKTILRISIADWDNKFLMVFETEKNEEDAAFFISYTEVKELLENCRRVPEQQSKK